MYQTLHAMGLPECEACKARAFQMDVWGVEGCKEKMGTIIQWLRFEASRAISSRRLDDKIQTFIESVLEGM